MKSPTHVARYAGLISRWCDLTGNVPDATKRKDKQAAELESFATHLNHLAEMKRKRKAMEF